MNNEWKPLTDAQRDGEEWIVGWDSVGVWIVASAWWDQGELWQDQGFGSQDEARGWWSYIHSVTQEQIEPTHYLCPTP